MRKKTLLGAAVIGVAVVTASCAAPGDSSDKTELEATADSELAADYGAFEEPAPEAFHFESGDLVIGPFDPEEIKHNLFDPCSEISDAEFAAAGLVKDEVQPDQSELEGLFIRTCAMKSDDPYETVLLVSNAAPKSIILTSSPELTLDEHLVPGAFGFGPPSLPNDVCDAAVETNRGTFSASIGTLNSSKMDIALCQKAIAVLDGIYGFSNSLE